MNSYDPVIIIFIFVIILMFITVLISKIVPKHMHMKSSDSSIKKGKFIGAVIGISISLFMNYYLYKNNFFGLLDLL
tara:strand:+ start:1655 stop:1882 length:228 start_codon:yes stop_codon:yes gene_type:complete